MTLFHSIYFLIFLKVQLLRKNARYIHCYVHRKQNLHGILYSWKSIHWMFTLQHYRSSALKLLGKTPQTQIILSSETPWTLYNYIYLEYNTAYGAKYWWYNMAQNKNQKITRHGTQCVIQFPTNWNPAQSMLENAKTVFGPRMYNSLPKYLRDIKSVKTEKFECEPDKFLEFIPDESKCRTMLPQLETTASSTSNRILGLKEFTKVVESPTWLRSRLSCFEIIPSIQLSLQV